MAKPWEPWRLQFSIGQAERSGTIVGELQDAEATLGSFRMGPITLTVTAGDRIALLGDNGAGKTTLVAMLLGEQQLTSGTHRLGRSVVVGRLGQDRGVGFDERPFLEGFASETGLTPTEARSLLAKFGLGAEHLSRPARGWSPGERTRAALAGFQATGVNTLVVDEPTNHLDLPAIEQLEGALDRFEGTLILITHDRAFLDSTKLTRHISIADGKIITAVESSAPGRHS